jgi:hypothetical protein
MFVVVVAAPNVDQHPHTHEVNVARISITISNSVVLVRWASMNALIFFLLCLDRGPPQAWRSFPLWYSKILWLLLFGITSPLSPRASRPSPRASRLAPRASRLSPRASRLAPRASRLSPLTPIPCEHLAWSPRAKRGVVRDPRRFLAALGMTRTRHLQASLVSPLASRLAPLHQCEIHLALRRCRTPLAAPPTRDKSRATPWSRLAPRASRLAPRASHLSPLPSRLSPLASHLSPLIPIPCDHPAWSPRAKRGVVRDPRRFLAAFTLSEAKGSE